MHTKFKGGMSIAVTLARTAGYDFQLDATVLVLWGRNYVINIVIRPISTYLDKRRHPLS